VGEVRGGGQTTCRVQTSQTEAAARVLTELGVTAVGVGDGVVHGAPGDVAADKIVAALVHAGVAVSGFAVTRPSLEDLFVSLTGEGFDVSG